jgi:hypothetical protein
VRKCLTSGAKRNEVRSGIIACTPTKLLVVDFQIRHGTAKLTAPAMLRAMEKTDFEQCLAKAEEQPTLLKAAQENAEREKQPRKLGEDMSEKRQSARRKPGSYMALMTEKSPGNQAFDGLSHKKLSEPSTGNWSREVHWALQRHFDQRRPFACKSFL